MRSEIEGTALIVLAIALSLRGPATWGERVWRRVFQGVTQGERGSVSKCSTRQRPYKSLAPLLSLK